MFFPAKCAQKQLRCTFVKFHRQTAPVGPGHNPRPSSSQMVYSQREDYVLDPALSVSSVSDNLYYQKLGFSHGTRPSIETQEFSIPNPSLDSDTGSKYRAQTELVDRGGMTLPANATQMPGQALFLDPPSLPSWADWSQNQLGRFNAVPGDTSIANSSLAARYLLDENGQLAFSHQFAAPGDQAFSNQTSRSHNTAYPTRSVNGDNFRSQGIGLAHIRRGSRELSADRSSSSPASATEHLPDMASEARTAYQVLDVIANF